MRPRGDRRIGVLALQGGYDAHAMRAFDQLMPPFDPAFERGERPLAATPFRPTAPSRAGVPDGALERLALPGVASPRLVFVDGRYSPKLSTARPLPGGGQVASLAEAMITDADMIERHLGRYVRWDRNVFAALNTAFVQDGGFVCLPPEALGETPIELVFLATTPGVVAQPRTHIVG